jgi:hypothetical protein
MCTGRFGDGQARGRLWPGEPIGSANELVAQILPATLEHRFEHA